MNEDRALERDRYDAVTRLLEDRLERGFARLDRKAGKPIRPWRESADEWLEKRLRSTDAPV